MDLKTLKQILATFPEDDNGYCDLKIEQTKEYQARIIITVGEFDIAVGNISFTPIRPEEV